MDIAVADITDDQCRMLLATEENHFADLKALEASPANITRTISAFANTSGGEIYVGISEQVGARGLERAWHGFANVEAATD